MGKKYKLKDGRIVIVSNGIGSPPIYKPFYYKPDPNNKMDYKSKHGLQTFKWQDRIEDAQEELDDAFKLQKGIFKGAIEYIDKDPEKEIQEVEVIPEPQTEIKILPEFENLLPPLTDEEFNGLDADIIANGCRDPLIIWNGILIDGHNRYKICKRHYIKYEIFEMNFDSEDDAKLWIIKNQGNRRNITPYARAELALNMKPILEEKARERKIAGVKKPNLPLISAEGSAGETREQIAELAGVGKDTISKVDYISKNADEEMKSKLRKGEKGISINKAYEDLKEKEDPDRKKKKKKKKESIQAPLNQEEIERKEEEEDELIKRQEKIAAESFYIEISAKSFYIPGDEPDEKVYLEHLCGLWIPILHKNGDIESYNIEGFMAQKDFDKSMEIFRDLMDYKIKGIVKPKKDTKPEGRTIEVHFPGRLIQMLEFEESKNCFDMNEIICRAVDFYLNDEDD